MRKIAVVFIGLFAMSTIWVSAQDHLVEVYEREHIPNKKPVP
jgi:hypothetical protein